MKYLVIKAFKDRGVLQPPGSIIHVPGAALVKLAGYVQPLSCQARKVGGRICGAPLREGINGHLSCSDMRCQVPYKMKCHPGTRDRSLNTDLPVKALATGDKQ